MSPGVVVQGINIHPLASYVDNLHPVAPANNKIQKILEPFLVKILPLRQLPEQIFHDFRSPGGTF